MNNLPITEHSPPDFSKFHFSERIQSYLKDIIQSDVSGAKLLVSLVVFGSATTGGYSEKISDVDLLLVIRDEASDESKRCLENTVLRLEAQHGLDKSPVDSSNRLETFIARLTATTKSFFTCTRRDLLSGTPQKILGIPAIQSLFVDRAAVPAILSSGITIWGEELSNQISLPPLRRLDVGKAFLGLFNQVLFCAISYPFLPAATKYAMDALKRSVHNCYFCYQLSSAALCEEISFFHSRHGKIPALSQLAELRREYRPSFKFVVNCFPAIIRLHLYTALDNEFPRKIVLGKKHRPTKENE